jgi:hypothetical protein
MSLSDFSLLFDPKITPFKFQQRLIFNSYYVIYKILKREVIHPLIIIRKKITLLNFTMTKYVFGFSKPDKNVKLC